MNLSAVYVSQVLHRAESHGVPIDIDLSMIEDQNSMDQIANMAASGFATWPFCLSNFTTSH